MVKKQSLIELLHCKKIRNTSREDNISAPDPISINFIFFVFPISFISLFSFGRNDSSSLRSQNVEEVLKEAVTGKKSTSQEKGDTIKNLPQHGIKDYVKKHHESLSLYDYDSENKWRGKRNKIRSRNVGKYRSSSK